MAACVICVSWTLRLVKPPQNVCSSSCETTCSIETPPPPMKLRGKSVFFSNRRKEIRGLWLIMCVQPPTRRRVHCGRIPVARVRTVCNGVIQKRWSYDWLREVVLKAAFIKKNTHCDSMYGFVFSSTYAEENVHIMKKNWSWIKNGAGNSETPAITSYGYVFI